MSNFPATADILIVGGGSAGAGNYTSRGTGQAPEHPHPARQGARRQLRGERGVALRARPGDFAKWGERSHLANVCVITTPVRVVVAA
jgi:hypothetical protein